MPKHLFCCQNMLQNFHDHIIPVPDDFDINPSIMRGMDKQDFISGLKELTDIIRSIYIDMIQSPAEYGLPMVEDIEYAPFNPKAAASKHSANRLISLLHTLVQCGELCDSSLIVDGAAYSNEAKKLKITNNKMILKKICDFGFVYDNNVLTYSDSYGVIPVLYAYMKNVRLTGTPVFSLNYFLTAAEWFSSE